MFNPRSLTQDKQLIAPNNNLVRSAVLRNQVEVIMLIA